MKKPAVDKYFLDEACPFTGRRRFNMSRLRNVGLVSVVVIVLSLLLFTPSPKLKSAVESVDSTQATYAPEKNTSLDYLDSPKVAPKKDSPSLQASQRQYGSSQLVKRGEGLGDKVPMGTTIPAKLVNSVLSSDSNSPVIAEIAEDLYWKGAVAIPATSKAIGQGSVDENTERLQIRFHTVVFPSGEQHSLSALALLPDGSSGLPGDYHSKTFKREAGKFIGNFAGGLAQGLKEKEVNKEKGIVFEPGSIRNGILNGVSTSSFDGAKSFSESLQGSKPYLEIPAGGNFLIYLEKEFGQ